MTAVAGALLALTLLIALADWVAVAVDRRPLEYVLKPATMVALGAVVLALDLPGGQLRWWYLAAIILSLAGDVFLMLPESAMDPELSFVAGLGSFLVAHVLYVVGMVLRRRAAYDPLSRRTRRRLHQARCGVGTASPRD